MNRTLITGLLAGAALAATVVLVTPAAAAPRGGGILVRSCPKGGDWHLLPVAAAIPAVDNGDYSDQNGDGWGCFRINKGQTDKHGGFESFTWKDNTGPYEPLPPF